MNYPCENKYLETYDFIDLWLEKHSHMKGYSWDPKRNSMLNIMLPLENRRMRLDRIWVKNNTEFIIDDISMFGDRRIGNWLYPSDHWGIIANFRISKHQGYNIDNARSTYKLEFDYLPQKRTGFRSFKWIMIWRTVAIILIILAIIALILGVFKVIFIVF